MLDALLRLLEEKEFGRCLRLADQLMLRGGWSLAEMAIINLAVCRARLGLNDPYGGIAAGTLAVKLAHTANEHDLMGESLLYLGCAYGGVRQYDHALEQFRSFFQHRASYREAARLEGAVWRQIGQLHLKSNDTAAAVEAFQAARAWFQRQEDDRGTFDSTHELITTLLQIAEKAAQPNLGPVKELLDEQRAVVGRLGADPYYRGHYLLGLAGFYLRQGRHGRAIVAAHGAIRARGSDRLLAVHSHLILHRCCLVLNRPSQAMTHALTARVLAVESRHFDLEFLASQAMTDVIKHDGPTVVRALDREFLAMGVDLGRYFSPWVLGREH